MRQRQAAAASGGQPPHETYQAAIYALRDVLTHCYRTSTDRSGPRKIQQRESAKGRDSASHLANTPGLPEAPGGLRIGSPLLPEGRAPQPRRGLAARSETSPVGLHKLQPPLRAAHPRPRRDQSWAGLAAPRRSQPRSNTSRRARRRRRPRPASRRSPRRRTPGTTSSNNSRTSTVLMASTSPAPTTARRRSAR